MAVITLANSLLAQDTQGVGIQFPLTIDPSTRDFVLVSDDANIQECIRWLIASRVGERVMFEDMGTSVNSSLFTDIEAAADVLPHQISEVINTYEPRVKNVRVQTERTGINDLRVTVTYTIRATNRRDNIVYPFSVDPTNGGF